MGTPSFDQAQDRLKYPGREGEVLSALSLKEQGEERDPEKTITESWLQYIGVLS